MKELVSSNVLIPTKTRSGSSGQTSLKTASSYDKSAPLKKLVKFILTDEKVIEEEIEEEDNQPLIRKTKELEKQAHDLFIGAIPEGAKMIPSSLKNEVMDESLDTDVMEEQDLQVETTKPF